MWSDFWLSLTDIFVSSFFTQSILSFLDLSDLQPCTLLFRHVFASIQQHLPCSSCPSTLHFAFYSCLFLYRYCSSCPSSLHFALHYLPFYIHLLLALTALQHYSLLFIIYLHASMSSSASPSFNTAFFLLVTCLHTHPSIFPLSPHITSFNPVLQFSFLAFLHTTLIKNNQDNNRVAHNMGSSSFSSDASFQPLPSGGRLPDCCSSLACLFIHSSSQLR